MIRPSFAAGIAALSLTACMHRAPEYPAPIPRVDAKPVVAFSLREIDLSHGTGELVAPRKCLYAHYTGWLTDGRKLFLVLLVVPHQLAGAGNTGAASFGLV